MMIKTLSVKNFGCLKDVQLNLEPFTVLVGPNDSGKSMILRALEHLALAHSSPVGWLELFPTPSDFTAMTFGGRRGEIEFALSGELGAKPFQYQASLGSDEDHHFTPPVDVFAESLSLEPTLKFSRTQSRIDFDFPYGHVQNISEKILINPYLPTLKKSFFLGTFPNSQDPASGPKAFAFFAPFLDALCGLRRYSFRVEQLRQFTPVGGIPKQPINSGGAGLPGLIHDLLSLERKTFDKIEVALSQAMPQVEHINIKTVANKNRPTEFGYLLEFEASGGAKISSDMISDGVLLFLGYLTLVMGPQPASVLLIEEPETGIHPGLLEKVVTLLKDLTRGVYGAKPVQVIITTHSPILLNYVEPKEIRVVQRGKDGATCVDSFEDTPALRQLLEFQGPGEIWVNMKESYITGVK